MANTCRSAFGGQSEVVNCQFCFCQFKLLQLIGELVLLLLCLKRKPEQEVNVAIDGACFSSHGSSADSRLSRFRLNWVWLTP